jgi:hypothetical protein
MGIPFFQNDCFYLPDTKKNVPEYVVVIFRRNCIFAPISKYIIMNSNKK